MLGGGCGANGWMREVDNCGVDMVRFQRGKSVNREEW